MRFYSCNSDDYGGFMEESHKNLEIATFVHELNRQGDECPICKNSMNDPSKLPKEDKEVYLTCGHKFHKECIDQYGKIMEIEGPIPMDQPEEPMGYAEPTGYEREISEIMNEIQVEQFYIEREIRDLRPQLTNVPTMRA